MQPDRQRTNLDLENSPSIRVPSKVTPTAEFLQQHLHQAHGEHGLRIPYHPATNPGKLSTPYTQLLTNANNNNYVRLQSSPQYEEPFVSKPSSSYSTPGISVLPHRHEVRVKDMHHVHLDEDPMQQQQHHHPNYHRYNHLHHHHQLAPIYHEQSMGIGRPISSHPGRHHQIMEIEPDFIRQASNQQLSNLVADNPRPMSHGTKYTYPAASNAQIQFPNRPLYHHYATNYHHLYHQPPHHHYHHYQPEQRNQLMMIKRPMMTRRPMLQTSHTMPQPSLPLPSRPVFLERKKSVYAPASPVYRRNQEKVSAVNGNVQISKLKKVDPKQWSKVEAKVSDTNAPNLFSTPMKPARNTGFDPGSIVIESGFKPIIRTLEKPTDVAEKRSSDKTDEEDTRGTTNHRPNDNFGPVFIPSPPVPTVDTVKRSKKKPRLGEVEDMEMAADRMNAYYLPPVPSTITNESPSSPSSEVLITFDGKRLKDSGLARSISGIEEHSKSTLSSDVLSRTPQFGRFKGELPPLIPGEARSQLEKHRPSYKDSLLAETTPIKNTKLTLVMRSKRSPHEGHVHLTNSSDTDHFDHHSHNDHHDHHDHQSNSSSLLVSTGETIMANLGYIFLTVVFYYII